MQTFPEEFWLCDILAIKLKKKNGRLCSPCIDISSDDVMILPERFIVSWDSVAYWHYVYRLFAYNDPFFQNNSSLCPIQCHIQVHRKCDNSAVKHLKCTNKLWIKWNSNFRMNHSESKLNKMFMICTKTDLMISYIMCIWFVKDSCNIFIWLKKKHCNSRMWYFLFLLLSICIKWVWL